MHTTSVGRILRRSGEEKQKVFEGTNCITEFCLWLFKGEQHQNAVCLAHNLKGYDGYFILQFLYDNAVKPDVIMNGAKIMSITVPGMGITFKDSLNYFPMALSKLPKAFGIQELCKGYFPISFTRTRTRITTVNSRKLNGTTPTVWPRPVKKSSRNGTRPRRRR